jgi:hypothetical protein
VRRIRVVLAEMPPLLNDIVRTILGSQPDMDVEPAAVPTHEIASARTLVGADVLILAEERSQRDDYAPALYAHPRLRLVAISDDRRGAVLYELRQHRSPLGEPSSESLVRAVRAQSANEGRA